MDPTHGFEPFSFNSEWNYDLTRHFVFQALKRSIERQLAPEEYRVFEGGFLQEIDLLMCNHVEGDEVLVIQPYFLKAIQRVGFLVDFHFKLKKGIAFNRRILQLSLSLDKNLRRNLDYCSDRAAKIREFVERRWSIFQGLVVEGASNALQVSKEFAAVPADRLRSKIYTFAHQKESQSQFMGLREFGPLSSLEVPPTLLFVFREQDRQAARLLAVSLKGMKQRGQFNFPGFARKQNSTPRSPRDPISCVSRRNTAWFQLSNSPNAVL